MKSIASSDVVVSGKLDGLLHVHSSLIRRDVQVYVTKLYVIRIVINVRTATKHEV